MLALRIPAFDRLRSLLRLDERYTVDKAAPLSESATADKQSQVASKKIKSLLPLASAAERLRVTALVQQLAVQMPFALAIAVLHAEADMPLAHAGNSRTTSPASMAVQFGRIARLSIEMADGVSPQEGPLQEMICVSDQQIHLLSPIGDRQWWLYMAVETKDTNLAIARALLQTACELFTSEPPAGATT